jgi:hypothetical protein
MPSHRIRLAGPWELRLIDAHQQPDGDSVRCQLPFNLSESRHATGVRLTRGFHHPTGVDDTTKLRIVLQSTDRPLAVRVNGKGIDECGGTFDGEYVFDITGRIAAFNELSVFLESANPESAATLKTVWLEIQS